MIRNIAIRKILKGCKYLQHLEGCRSSITGSTCNTTPVLMSLPSHVTYECMEGVPRTSYVSFMDTARYHAMRSVHAVVEANRKSGMSLDELRTSLMDTRDNLILGRKANKANKAEPG